MLVAIDDLGQLKKVAESLNVTPPAISKQIAEIEDDLQQKIFHRVGNRVEFTEVGSLLARHARQVLEQLERTRIELNELCSGIGGQIGLGAVPTVAPFFLPALVSDLKARAPNTSVRLREGRFAELAPLLDDRTLDIVLARETEHRLSVNFTEEKVMTDPLALVCGPQHTLATRKRLNWEDLNDMPWVLPIQGTSTHLLLENLLSEHGVTMGHGCVESISLAVNTTLLQTSSFLGLMPLAYVREHLRVNRLYVLPLSTGGIQNEIKAVWRKDNPNPMNSLLLEFIRQHAIVL
jgi:DNA-binding transcriptional LysR family regulator